jgi:hypothetical protein
VAAGVTDAAGATGAPTTTTVDVGCGVASCAITMCDAPGRAKLATLNNAARPISAQTRAAAWRGERDEWFDDDRACMA